MIYTTLKKIHAHNPCRSGWKRLLKHLGKTKADNRRLSMLTILKSNGLYDALWCIRACDGVDRKVRLFAVACARRVQHLMTDQRSINAVDVAERYANGQATDADLRVAWDAAETAWLAASEDASWAAAQAAAETAWLAASEDASWAAAWDAAESAACAARDAACDACVEREAAVAAERKWQAQEFKRVFCGGGK